MRPAPIGLGDGATSSDHELVARSRVDRDAFAELYRRHVDSVYALVYRRSWSRETAEDVTAATFERALGRLDTFDARRGAFTAWLLRIAANELIDHHRREARPGSERGQQSMRAHSTPFQADDTDAMERADEIQGMLDALGTLRPRYQEVLTLRYLAGLEPAEAAVALGCSKATLAVQLHRALDALRRAVGTTRHAVTEAPR